MCTGAEIALLAASAASTVGGTVMANEQQKKSMRRYNNEVSDQNRLLSQQYAERQNQINNARDQQAKVFQEIGAQQDAEFAKQTELAKKKQQVFQQAAEQSVNKGAESQEFADAVANRMNLFNETAPADYGASTSGGTENRVLREAAEKSHTAAAERSGGIANALARMGALNDVGQRQNDLFRSLDTNLGDVAKEANTSSNLLSAKLRTPEYRMGALSAVMGEAANTPYYRGQEPVYRTPNTLFADALKGAGQLGMTGYFMGAGMPKTGKWINPDTGATVPIRG